MKVLENDGLKYVDQGNGNVILFFHGWGMSPFTYQAIITSLASKFRIIAPFITTFRELEKEKILKILNKEPKIIVVAHSAGGVMALLFCATFPDKIKALILIDSLGSGRSDSIKQWSWLREAGRYLVKPSKLTVVLFTDILRQLINVKKLLGDSNFILSYKTDLKPNFPVLLLWGKEDSLIPIENGYNLNKLMPKAEFKSVSGKHFWFLEKPEVLSKNLEEFLNK
jgi:pimeloyl-ACP methyl ester carboxylesterase